MAFIQIKNIGPLADTGRLELRPVMLLIGKQSTGKSTLMKILCFCSWIEKKIMIEGEDLVAKYTHYGRFVKELKSFHRFDSEIYFRDDSEIHFEGDCIKIDLVGEKNNAKIIRKPNYDADRYNTKISFVPSERNIVSAIKNVGKAYKSTDYDVLYNYLWEFDEAKAGIKDRRIEMPFDKNIAYYYDAKSESDMFYMRQLDTSIEAVYASSGVQSAMPVMVLLEYLTTIVGTNRALSLKDINNAVAKVVLNKDLHADDLSEVDLTKVRQLLYYKNCQLFIEELEQNLFPQSQSAMVEAIIRKIKEASVATGTNSRVVLTSHSPYVLTTLNLLMKASQAFRKSPTEAITVIGEDLVLPIDYYSAYWISEEGYLEDIVDHEYGFIIGDRLDQISEILSDETARLDDIIYG